MSVKVETNEPYPLGNTYRSMPIPMVPEHCITVEAGPIQLVVEARQLTDDLLAGRVAPEDRDEADRRADHVDDYGASLHVVGTDDGLEHLRFDCFAHDPHYHYVRHAEHVQTVIALDHHAEGDAIAWTLTRVRNRLPEMLEYAGMAALADQVRAASDKVQAATDEVEELLARAQVQAEADHAALGV